MTAGPRSSRISGLTFRVAARVLSANGSSRHALSLVPVLFGIQAPFIDGAWGVEFGLGEGGTLGLVGESGAGKSTIARAVMGLVPAADGSVTFDGPELVGLPNRRFNKVRRDMATMC